MSPEWMRLTAEVVYLVLGLLVVIVVVVPPVATALGMSRVTCSELQPIPEIWDRDFPIHPHLYEQLHELGFKLLGGIRVRYWLWYHFWCWPRRYRVFGDHHSFVLVSRSVFRKHDEVALVTLFDDGSWVWTANYPWLSDQNSRRHISQTFTIDPRWTMNYRFSRLLSKHRGTSANMQIGERKIIQHDYLPVVVDSHRRWAKRVSLTDWLLAARDALFMLMFGAWNGVVLLNLHWHQGTSWLLDLAIVSGLCLLASLLVWGGWCEARSSGILAWFRREKLPVLAAVQPHQDCDILAPLGSPACHESSEAIRPDPNDQTDCGIRS